MFSVIRVYNIVTDWSEVMQLRDLEVLVLVWKHAD